MSLVPADPTVTAEDVQAVLLQLIRKIGFTEEQIEENRRYNGCLFLTPNAMIGAMGRFEPGTQVRTETGELILTKEAQGLVELKDMFDELIDCAEAKFQDLDDLAQRSTFISFCGYASGRLEELEHEMRRERRREGDEGWAGT
jgi:hypothetical protein